MLPTLLVVLLILAIAGGGFGHRRYYGPGGVTDTRRGPVNTLWHSYWSGPRAVGVGVDREGRAVWEGHSRGSAHRTRGVTAEQLRKYLQAARRREQRKR